MLIEQDTWEEWKSHPVTEAFFNALLGQALLEQQKWMAASWVHGQADPMILNTHRERARLLEQWADITPELIEDILK